MSYYFHLSRNGCFSCCLPVPHFVGTRFIASLRITHRMQTQKPFPCSILQEATLSRRVYHKREQLGTNKRKRGTIWGIVMHIATQKGAGNVLIIAYVLTGSPKI